MAQIATAADCQGWRQITAPPPTSPPTCTDMLPGAAVAQQAASLSRVIWPQPLNNTTNSRLAAGLAAIIAVPD